MKGFPDGTLVEIWSQIRGAEAYGGAKGFQTIPIDIQKFPNESFLSSKEEEEDALRVQLDNLESDTKLKGNCDHGLPI